MNTYADQCNAHLERVIAVRSSLYDAAKMALEDCCDLISTEAGIALEVAVAKYEELYKRPENRPIEEKA